MRTAIQRPHNVPTVELKNVATVHHSSFARNAKSLLIVDETAKVRIGRKVGIRMLVHMQPRNTRLTNPWTPVGKPSCLWLHRTTKRPG
mmetsp:Transcript_46828/g.92657  ORF Transcript_46828/g.92657 Transcript_46828/m.92657 type:complete len:88 (+) Transcript_46828:69-332(+)